MRPAALFDCRAHPRPGPVRFDVIVELGSRRQNTLDELSRRRIIDRFGYPMGTPILSSRSAGFPKLLDGQARCGGSKFLPIESQSIREEDLLKLLLLVQGKLHPESRGVRQQVPGKT